MIQCRWIRHFFSRRTTREQTSFQESAAFTICKQEQYCYHLTQAEPFQETIRSFRVRCPQVKSHGRLALLQNGLGSGRVWSASAVPVARCGISVQVLFVGSSKFQPVQGSLRIDFSELLALRSCVNMRVPYDPSKRITRTPRKWWLYPNVQSIYTELQRYCVWPKVLCCTRRRCHRSDCYGCLRPHPLENVWTRSDRRFKFANFEWIPCGN